MASTTATPVREGNIAWGRLPLAGLVATVGAAGANAVVYFIAAALGAFPQSVIVPNAGGPLTLALVIISSLIGAVAAIIVFAAIGWFARRPIRLFRIVAAITLILSFVSPFSIPDAPVGMILSLELMHIIAAAIIVWALTTLARNPR
jgi:hypothetical protein